jgi:hypothetical protein
MAALMSISYGQAVGPAAVPPKKRKKIAATTKKEKKDGAKEKPKRKRKKAKILQPFDSPAMATRSKKLLFTSPSKSTRSIRRLSR